MMFLDASAIVAILAQEPDADALIAKIQTSETNFYFSPLSLFEAAAALARAKTIGAQVAPETIEGALDAVLELLRELDAREISITSKVARGALTAMQMYGRAVGHPARLNLGDCFAYACARAADAPLLYKGDDFAQTDLA
jgi:ribonuclease VapC